MNGTSYLATKIRNALIRDGYNLDQKAYHSILSAVEDLPIQCQVSIQIAYDCNGEVPFSWLSFKAFINTLPLNEKISRSIFQQHFKDISIKQDKKQNAKFRQYLCNLKARGYITTTHNHFIVKQHIPIDFSSTRYWKDLKPTPHQQQPWTQPR
jgi:hypothetical protein